MRPIAVAAALTLLAACGSDEGAGGLTAEESRKLNETAAMLDEAPETLPADETAGPEEPASGGEAEAQQ